ncbi:hypothetical protein CTRI78_v006384 [Colletotrichum trifolii]|uniref:Swim zinc finger domain protein n=1 Tax=Colletotrichum trifolii TaxID=5466 RepID=A0A4R8RCJ8_COLTR|nr:hypothetical protein CTRI78_v006384 [Colletotrichum trifolii]
MNYSFGIEIEAIVRPHKIRPNLPSLHALYYSKLAASLRKRNLDAQSDPLILHKKHPEHYDKWWITKDVSLRDGIVDHMQELPIEAVSPVMTIREDWEDEIDTFWAAMRVVFHMPRWDDRCGSHIHVSNGYNTRYNTPFSLSQLKTIAFGVVLYEPLIQQLLMANRANNRYCVANTMHSAQLSACRGNRAEMARLIRNARNAAELCAIMQNDRFVLWNFENTLPNKSGTIEFRGGRCLRGDVRTKRWIACTVSLVDAILRMNNIKRLGEVTLSHWTPDSLYAAVKKSARALDLRGSLPDDYRILNETQR